MDRDLKIVVGLTVFVGAGLIARDYVIGEAPPDHFQTCRGALASLESAATAEGSDTCQEIDPVRDLANRDADDQVVPSLQLYSEHPPHGCRSLSVEMAIGSALRIAHAECSAAARAHARE